MLGTARSLLSARRNISWAIFDAEFYGATNQASAEVDDPDMLLEHYLTRGAPAGYSPNHWFVESFYRSENPELEDLIASGEYASGFDHYCQVGYPDRAPHWLFDPAFYQVNNSGLTEAVLQAAHFANLYDHYLKFGAIEGRRAHRDFDPTFYAEQLSEDQAAICRQIGPFRHFLSQHLTGNPPTQSALKLKLNIDRPKIVNGQATEPLHDHLDLVGWAAANHPVVSVDIYIDNEHCGRAHHGIRTDGVAATFPELTHSQFAGFRFVGPTPVPPGRHQMHIVARGQTGIEAAETFDVDIAQTQQRDGPWNLRRRMRLSEAGFKQRLLDKAGLAPTFLIIIARQGDQSAAAAAARTRRSLDRQIYTRWHLHGAELTTEQTPDLWLIQITPGDELGVDALLELALHRLLEPDIEVIYSDERRPDPTTGEITAFFKPGWSPDLLLSTNYIGRLWAASRTWVEHLGLAAEDFASTNNYDLILRLTEAPARLAHLPLVLCETTSQPDPATDRAALQRAIDRREIVGVLEPGCLPASWRLRRAIIGLPLVSIIILTAGKKRLIESALQTLRARTAYPSYEVIIVDTTPATPAPWKPMVRDLADHVLEDPAPFNWSAMNNRAARHASGDLLLFLNDDVEFTDPDWLSALIEHAQRPEIGVVGPLLLYPDGIIQEAGMFLTRTGGGHAFHGLAGTSSGPFGLAQTPRNVIAVTGACLMVRRDVFERLDGFNETFDVINNDLDFCLRCEAAALAVLFTSHAVLTHHESATRAGLDETPNAGQFFALWRHRLRQGDRWFNRNLSLAHSDYRPETEPIEIVYPSRPIAHPESIRRILVIKLDHLGDFLLSLPAVRCLKKRFPNARITVLLSTANATLAPMELAIDATIPFDFFQPRPAQGVRAIPADEWHALLARLNHEEFDLAVDLRCHHETRSVLEGSGATWRAGFDAAYVFPWLDIVGLMEADQAGQAKRTHIADTLLDFAERVAASFTPTFDASLTTAQFPWPAAIVPPPPGHLRIAVHPGAGSEIKRWPAQHFADLIGELAADRPCWIVLVGNADEYALADAILSTVAPSEMMVSSVGNLRLDDLAGMLSKCDLFIGNDSGPQHLATALGVPTIGIHSGVVDATEWGPALALSVRRRVLCAPCYVTNIAACPRGLACLEGLGPTISAHLICKGIASRIVTELGK